SPQSNLAHPLHEPSGAVRAATVPAVGFPQRYPAAVKRRPKSWPTSPNVPVRVKPGVNNACRFGEAVRLQQGVQFRFRSIVGAQREASTTHRSGVPNRYRIDDAGAVPGLRHPTCPHKVESRAEAASGEGWDDLAQEVSPEYRDHNLYKVRPAKLEAGVLHCYQMGKVAVPGQAGLGEIERILFR